MTEDLKHTIARTYMDCGPIAPGSWGHVTARNSWTSGEMRPYRVVNVHVVAEYPLSRFARFMRRIPVVAWLLQHRDEKARAQAAAQIRINHVSVDFVPLAPDMLAELPMVRPGRDVEVHVTNTSKRPISVSILIEGALS